MSDPDDASNEPTPEPTAEAPTSPASDVQAEILAAMDGSTLAEADPGAAGEAGEAGETGETGEAASDDAAGDEAADG